MNTKNQKQVFLNGEGDNYFSRHRDLKEPLANDAVLDALKHVHLPFTSFLEIGCSNGYRVNAMARMSGAIGVGIDPSSEAISIGRDLYGDAVNLQVATADRLPFDDDSFDLVIIGFCMYLTDVSDHFKIAAEVSRVLRDHGSVVLFDFLSSVPHFNEYTHHDGLVSRKMDYSRYFLASPGFRLIYRHARPYDAALPIGDNNCEVVDIVKKDFESAFISNPF